MLHRPLRKNLLTCRAGKLTLLLLFAFPLLLAIGAFAVNAALLHHAKVTQQGVVNASALAAAQALVDDQLLCGSSSTALLHLIDQAKNQAQQYSQWNPLAGKPLHYQNGSDNNVCNDVLFGNLPFATSKNFTPINFAELASLGTVNAVRVTGRRAKDRKNAVPLVFGPLFTLSSRDVVTIATAALDHGVVGFHAPGPDIVPLLPIALFSDPTGQDKKSWEHQVEKATIDQWQRVLGQFSRGRDGLFEMTVTLGHDGLDEDAKNKHINGCLLQINVEDFTGLVGQIHQGGLAPADFTALGGKFDLDAVTHQRVVPGSLLGPHPQKNSGGFKALRDALVVLQDKGQAYAWPLFVGYDHNDMPVIGGFVAARVANVRLAGGAADNKDNDDGDDDADDDSPKGGPARLTITLQAALLATPAAITDSAPRGPTENQQRIINPYLCRVRLVE